MTFWHATKQWSRLCSLAVQHHAGSHVEELTGQMKTQKDKLRIGTGDPKRNGGGSLGEVKGQLRQVSVELFFRLGWNTGDKVDAQRLGDVREAGCSLHSLLRNGAGGPRRHRGDISIDNVDDVEWSRPTHHAPTAACLAP